jgi:hypothetical protein
MLTQIQAAADQMETVLNNLNEAFSAASNDSERWMVHKQIETIRKQKLDLHGLYRQVAHKEKSHWPSKKETA